MSSDSEKELPFKKPKSMIKRALLKKAMKAVHEKMLKRRKLKKAPQKKLIDMDMPELYLVLNEYAKMREKERKVKHEEEMKERKKQKKKRIAFKHIGRMAGMDLIVYLLEWYFTCGEYVKADEKKRGVQPKEALLQLASRVEVGDEKKHKKMPKKKEFVPKSILKKPPELDAGFPFKMIQLKKSGVKGKYANQMCNQKNIPKISMDGSWIIHYRSPLSSEDLTKDKKTSSLVKKSLMEEPSKKRGKPNSNKENECKRAKTTGGQKRKCAEWSKEEISDKKRRKVCSEQKKLKKVSATKSSKPKVRKVKDVSSKSRKKSSPDQMSLKKASTKNIKHKQSSKIQVGQKRKLSNSSDRKISAKRIRKTLGSGQKSLKKVPARKNAKVKPNPKIQTDDKKPKTGTVQKRKLASSSEEKIPIKRRKTSDTLQKSLKKVPIKNVKSKENCKVQSGKKMLKSKTGQKRKLSNSSNEKIPVKRIRKTSGSVQKELKKVPARKNVQVKPSRKVQNDSKKTRTDTIQKRKLTGSPEEKIPIKKRKTSDTVQENLKKVSTKNVKSKIQTDDKKPKRRIGQKETNDSDESMPVKKGKTSSCVKKTAVRKYNKQKQNSKVSANDKETVKKSKKVLEKEAKKSASECIEKTDKQKGIEQSKDSKRCANKTSQKKQVKKGVQFCDSVEDDIPKKKYRKTPRVPQKAQKKVTTRKTVKKCTDDKTQKRKTRQKPQLAKETSKGKIADLAKERITKTGGGQKKGFEAYANLTNSGKQIVHHVQFNDSSDEDDAPKKRYMKTPRFVTKDAKRKI